ncbi:hypothetical protein NDU88_002527 [Pleurodeles waltl]|uniref:Uncharacterized protein n=1 Tax=Pleurodeles waltl TaxID=8319 RepID=A0AAV7SFG2_PLEWA|nr:hypothetical protein NDU88_002527 [Pleurodeles waltl]
MPGQGLSQERAHLHPYKPGRVGLGHPTVIFSFVPVMHHSKMWKRKSTTTRDNMRTGTIVSYLRNAMEVLEKENGCVEAQLCSAMKSVSDKGNGSELSDQPGSSSSLHTALQQTDTIGRNQCAEVVTDELTLFDAAHNDVSAVTNQQDSYCSSPLAKKKCPQCRRGKAIACPVTKGGVLTTTGLGCWLWTQSVKSPL